MLPSDERRYVSPQQVARALGVSETTVKRWVDEGKLPASRTEGGHRKILARDVMEYVARRNWPHVNLSQLVGETAAVSPVDVPALAGRFHEALLAEDAERAREMVLRAHQSGLSAAHLADEVVSPVMAQVGHGWAGGQLDVYEEHRATQVCLAAMLALKARLESANQPPRGRPLALGGGPEFDHYILANLAVEMTLRESGWRVRNVGPNTPFASFRRAMADEKPTLVWLSCSYLADVEGFLAGYQAMYAEAVRLGAAVAVGGRALTDSVRSRMTFTHHGDRMSHLVAFARRLDSRR
ncbi:MAG: excisionase family DNA-binding protein [Gemmataceae bacterium]